MNGPAAHGSPAVSVIIRNYNRGERLTRSVKSVIEQDFGDYELIVVDDASTDDSLAHLYDMQPLDQRLRVIELARNRGAAGAANVGIEAARAHLVAFLDSDDEWLPQFLSSHVFALRQNARAAMSYCPVYNYWPEFAIKYLVAGTVQGDYREIMLRGGCVLTQSSTMTRRTALMDLGGFDESLTVSHDFDFYLRLGLRNPEGLTCVRKPLVRYALSSDGVTAKFDLWLKEYAKVIKRGYATPEGQPYKRWERTTLTAMTIALTARRETHRWISRIREDTVSVIIRTHNRLALLQRAFASVQAQQGPEFEIIIVDDASSDGTREWLEGLDLPDLKVVRLDEPRGRARALNLGVLAAEGDFVAFLDDDDEWLPSYLEAQMRAHSIIQGTPIFSYTDYLLVDAAGKETTHRHQPRFHSDDALHTALFSVTPHSMSMFMLERSLWWAVGGANENLQVGEDLDLQLRLLALRPSLKPGRGHPVQTERPLVKWYRNDAGMDRPAMLQLYIDTAPQLFEGFFATAIGERYRHLRGEVLANFREGIRQHFQRHVLVQGD